MAARGKPDSGFITGAKNSDAGNANRCGQVHGSAVVTDEQAGLLQYGVELSFRETGDGGPGRGLHADARGKLRLERRLPSPVTMFRGVGQQYVVVADVHFPRLFLCIGDLARPFVRCYRL